MLLEEFLPGVKQFGLKTKTAVDFSGAPSVALPGSVTIAGTDIITSNSANAFAVGPNGATNPSLNVDASTASAVTGLNIKSAASGSGITLSALGGTNESLFLAAKGTGLLGIVAETTSLHFAAGATTSDFAIVGGSSWSGYSATLNGVKPTAAILYDTTNGLFRMFTQSGGARALASIVFGVGADILSVNSTGITVAGTSALTSASATALAVGLNGATNPALNVDASTASQAAGLNIKGAATGGTVALAAIDSGSNTNLSLDGKGTGTISIGGISTGLVALGRGVKNAVIFGQTITSIGTAQNSTPTAAQVLGGVVTQTGSTGAGTVTLPTGTLLSGAIPGVATGDSFDCTFANLGGGFTLTITGATGMTVVGNGAIPSGKNGLLTFVNTGANTWNVYVVVSA